MGFVVGARSRTTGLNKLRHASKIFSKKFSKKENGKKTFLTMNLQKS